MILGIAAPFQDHASTIGISGIGEIVWEGIADVGDVVFLLPEVEVPRKHPFETLEVIRGYLSVVGHFYHGIHLEVRQLEMPKHVLGAHLADAAVIVAHQPGCYDHISLFKPVIADVDVGYVPGPCCPMYVAPISVVEIVVSGNEIELIKSPAQSLQGLQTEIQGLEIDRGPVMMPVAQEKSCFAVVCLGQFYGPVHEIGTVLIVLQAVGFQAKMYVREEKRSLE